MPSLFMKLLGRSEGLPSTSFWFGQTFAFWANIFDFRKLREGSPGGQILLTDIQNFGIVVSAGGIIEEIL